MFLKVIDRSPRAEFLLSLATDVATHHHHSQLAQLETSHFCTSCLSKRHRFLFEGNINCTTGNTSGKTSVISRPPNTSSTYQFTTLVSNLRNAFNGSAFLNTYQMPLNINVPKPRLQESSVFKLTLSMFWPKNGGRERGEKKKKKKKRGRWSLLWHFSFCEHRRKQVLAQAERQTDLHLPVAKQSAISKNIRLLMQRERKWQSCLTFQEAVRLFTQCCSWRK